MRCGKGGRGGGGGRRGTDQNRQQTLARFGRDRRDKQRKELGVTLAKAGSREELISGEAFWDGRCLTLTITQCTTCRSAHQSGSAHGKRVNCLLRVSAINPNIY